MFFSGEKNRPPKMSRFLDPFQRWKMGFRDAFFVVILIFFCFSRNNAEALGFVKGMVEWVGSSKSNVFKPRRSYIQMVLSIFSFPSPVAMGWLWGGLGARVSPGSTGSPPTAQHSREGPLDSLFWPSPACVVHHRVDLREPGPWRLT